MQLNFWFKIIALSSSTAFRIDFKPVMIICDKTVFLILVCKSSTFMLNEYNNTIMFPLECYCSLLPRTGFFSKKLSYSNLFSRNAPQEERPYPFNVAFAQKEEMMKLHRSNSIRAKGAKTSADSTASSVDWDSYLKPVPNDRFPPSPSVDLNRYRGFQSDFNNP